MISVSKNFPPPKNFPVLGVSRKDGEAGGGAWEASELPAGETQTDEVPAKGTPC